MTTPQSSRCPVFHLTVALALAIATSALPVAAAPSGQHGASAPLSISVTVVRTCTIENTATTSAAASRGEPVKVRCGKDGAGDPRLADAASAASVAKAGSIPLVTTAGRLVSVNF
jgi:hypothetical protein